MNTAYALFDKTGQTITFKYPTTITSPLNVTGLSTLSNLSVPATATINTGNITTGNITTGNITTGNVATLNATNATLSNVTASNVSILDGTAILDNIYSTNATLSNLTASNVSILDGTATLDALTTTGNTQVGGTLTVTGKSYFNDWINTSSKFFVCTNPDGYTMTVNQSGGTFTINNVNFGSIALTGVTCTISGNLITTNNATIGGSVGIGTATPTAKLDVLGDAKISGNVLTDMNVLANVYARNLFKKNYIITDTRVNSDVYTELTALSVPILAGYTYTIRGSLFWKPLGGSSGGGARFRFTLNDSILNNTNLNGIIRIDYTTSAVASGGTITSVPVIRNYFSNTNLYDTTITIDTTTIEQFYSVKFEAVISIDDLAPADVFKIMTRVNVPLAAPNQNVREVRVYEGSYVEYQYVWGGNPDGSHTTLW